MAQRKQHWSRYDLSGMTSAERDVLVLRMRTRGFTLKQIAEHVGMSVSGVYTVLERIAEGRPGRDPRH